MEPIVLSTYGDCRGERVEIKTCSIPAEGRPMSGTFRAYELARDFIRIRDFLLRTYAAFEAPVNWGIERWNYARYFVAPMLGSYGTETGTPEGSIQAIRLWEDLVGVWEHDGEIVGVATIEHPAPWHPGFGEIFVQRHPEHLHLLDEMLAYGERRFVNPKTKQVHIYVYEDDLPLLEIMERRGYVRDEKRSSSHLEYTIGDLPAPKLPEGFSVFTMAEKCDIERRREIFGRSFNHEDPEEWPSAFAYEELQRAPDYRKENDLCVAAPDGTYAACCIIWYDEQNRIGHLEPLGTHPAYRKRGLARELLLEGVRKLRDLGATKVPMTGGFDPFYEAFGFRKRRTCFAWVKKPQEA
jgi:predicted N-acetyltransferase YhbS